MTDIDLIRNLVASYCIEADSGRHREWAALFAEEGALFLNDQQVARGHENLIAWVTGRTLPAGFHMTSNLRLEIAGDRASGEANFVSVLEIRALGAMGSYRMRLVKCGVNWFILEWRIEVL